MSTELTQNIISITEAETSNQYMIGQYKFRYNRFSKQVYDEETQELENVPVANMCMTDTKTEDEINLYFNFKDKNLEMVTHGNRGKAYTNRKFDNYPVSPKGVYYRYTTDPDNHNECIENICNGDGKLLTGIYHAGLTDDNNDPVSNEYCEFFNEQAFMILLKTPFDQEYNKLLNLDSEDRIVRRGNRKKADFFKEMIDYLDMNIKSDQPAPANKLNLKL